MRRLGKAYVTMFILKLDDVQTLFLESEIVLGSTLMFMFHRFFLRPLYLVDEFGATATAAETLKVFHDCVSFFNDRHGDSVGHTGRVRVHAGRLWGACGRPARGVGLCVCDPDSRGRRRCLVCCTVVLCRITLF